MSYSATDLRVSYGAMKAERSVTTSNWKEYARYAWPENDFFWLQNNTASKGQQKNQRIYDSTAELSLDKFSALMQNLLTPHSKRWHEMEFMDPILNEDHDAKLYLQEITNRMFNMRYSGKTGFQHNLDLAYKNLGVYGTQALFIDYNKRDGLRYHSYFMGDIYIKENFQGRIDTVYRRFDFTPQQAIDAFPDGNIPDQIRRLANNKQEMNATNEYLHIVMPDDHFDQRKPTTRRFKSVYLLIDGGDIIEEGGYDTMPYIVSRFSLSPTEAYGRGPASKCFPDIKSVNAARRSIMRQGQRMVDPPILAYNDNRMSPGMTQTQLQNGGVVMGGVDENGRPTIQPWNSGAQLNAGYMEVEVLTNSIKAHFLVDMFEIFMNKDRMTATEFIGRDREKNVIISPAMDRQQPELLAMMIEREFDILGQMGLMPQKPPILEGRKSGVKPVYTSPLNRLQKAEEMQGMQAVMQEAIAIAPFNPAIMDTINDEAYLRLTVDGFGAPEKMIRSVDEIAAIRQQRAQQQQMAQQAEMQNQLADSNLKNAKARSELAGV